jgi:hypothetical protein
MENTRNALKKIKAIVKKTRVWHFISPFAWRVYLVFYKFYLYHIATLDKAFDVYWVHLHVYKLIHSGRGGINLNTNLIK